MTSKWENPEELSAEDQLMVALKEGTPRAGVLTIGAIAFATMQFGKGQKPDRATFIAFCENFLRAVMHTAEMDLLSFLTKEIMENKQGGLRDWKEITKLLASGAEVAKGKSLEHLTHAMNILRTLEGGSNG